MNIEDLINDLRDSLDDLRVLACSNLARQQQVALRINAGSIIATLREQLDDLDYAYAMFICELDSVTADHYRRIYLDAARAHAEVVA